MSINSTLTYPGVFRKKSVKIQEVKFLDSDQSHKVAIIVLLSTTHQSSLLAHQFSLLLTPNIKLENNTEPIQFELTGKQFVSVATNQTIALSYIQFPLNSQPEALARNISFKELLHFVARQNTNSIIRYFVETSANSVVLCSSQVFCGEYCFFLLQISLGTREITIRTGLLNESLCTEVTIFSFEKIIFLIEQIMILFMCYMIVLQSKN